METAVTPAMEAGITRHFWTLAKLESLTGRLAIRILPRTSHVIQTATYSDSSC